MHTERSRDLGIVIGYQSFGAVDSGDLMAESEVFDFYMRNASRYKNVLDIGANIGIHSVLMAKQGWNVTALEPDPFHYERLIENLRSNGVKVDAIRAAVSDHNGRETFVRVLGNTTGNHIEGSKNPYGEQERIEVSVLDCRMVFRGIDFAKIDCEGHEAVILTALEEIPDCMVEVGSEKNAATIFNHVRRPMFSQKTGWQRVKAIHDMPHHHSQGMLFIGDL